MCVMGLAAGGVFLLICLWGALAANERLGAEVDALRVEYECEQAWAEEYERRADAAESALLALRREYAVLMAAQERAQMAEMGSAWRAGLRKGKGKA